MDATCFQSSHFEQTTCPPGTLPPRSCSTSSTTSYEQSNDKETISLFNCFVPIEDYRYNHLTSTLVDPFVLPYKLLHETPPNLVCQPSSVNVPFRSHAL